MKLGRLIFFALAMFILITCVFLYINSDYVVSMYEMRKNREAEESRAKYIESPRKDYCYVVDGKIFILDGNHMSAMDFDGNLLYERVLTADDAKMMGAGGYIFFVDDESKTMDIIDSENHLIMESEPINNINGLREIGDKIVLYSDDGLNFETRVFDDNLDPYLSFLSKDASIDLVPTKDGFKVLSLRRTENGLSSLFSKVNTKKEITSLFELSGYVPLRLFESSGGDILVTDKEVILIKNGEVDARRTYEDFYGMEKINKNYILIADGETIIMDDSLNAIKKVSSSGLDHIYKLDKELVIYGGREFKVVGDDGLLSSVETERDIEKIHYDGRIVVEFRNGFLIY